jgi:hypothetical protein
MAEDGLFPPGSGKSLAMRHWIDIVDDFTAWVDFPLISVRERVGVREVSGAIRTLA